jgi:hypothetical protein
MSNNEHLTMKWLAGVTTVAAALVVTTGSMTAASLPGPTNPRAASQAAIAAGTGRTETPLSADDKPEAVARSRATRTALGIPGGVDTRAVHVKDGTRGLEYDEVTDVGADGQPVALTQLDGSGRLLLAVRFDMPKQPKVAAGRQAALDRASSGLGSAGIEVGGSPFVGETQSWGGWDVSWPRSEGGVAVRGDEVRVHVREDGEIGSVGRVVHELASAPAVKLTRAQARSIATKQIQGWSAKSGARFTIGDLTMEWTAANATFDPGKIGAVEEPYRLCWVVNVTPEGDAAAYASLVVMYIDAGTGAVIGGDVVE